MNEMSPDVQAAATRAEICRHALDLFSHYGFQKTNIGDIATRCEMSPGNLVSVLQEQAGYRHRRCARVFRSDGNRYGYGADAGGRRP